MTLPGQIDRRCFLRSLLLAGATAACGSGRLALTQTTALHQPLSAWTEGHFDIHHIDTGRGNSTLLVFPDATTLLIDAGAVNVPETTSSRPRPDSAHGAGQVQAAYILAHSPARHLDYFLATHIHPDHVGDVGEASPLAVGRKYRLTGVSDVDQIVPITTVIDRGFPDYRDAPPMTASFATNYVAYLGDRSTSGRRVECASVGSDRQIVLRNKQQSYPQFHSRILSANGRVWTGEGQQSRNILSMRGRSAAKPNENLYSVAVRFQYGAFSYFSGGDITFDTHDGLDPWMDVETPITRVAGRTEVATADHHGYFDACGPDFVRNLDAQVYIIQAWDIGHPGSAQMQRMLGAWQEDKATRDVFTTDLLPANALLNRRFAQQIKSQHGHVVIRVAPGGATYTIYTLDSTTEDGTVTGVFGPYTCRA